MVFFEIRKRKGKCSRINTLRFKQVTTVQAMNKIEVRGGERERKEG
jgi:hypothetical protein